MDPTSIYVSVVALLCALPIVWWLARAGRRCRARSRPAERLDTLAGWPPEPTRILRSSERLAFSTLKLALPGYLILAQVPLARFLTVPKRNSYAEWMRRLGNQCVDFVVCDVTSQVVAVVEVRPPMDQLDGQGQSPPRAGRACPEGGQDPAPRLERGEAADDRGRAREAPAERAGRPGRHGPQDRASVGSGHRDAWSAPQSSARLPSATPR